MLSIPEVCFSVRLYINFLTGHQFHSVPEIKAVSLCFQATDLLVLIARQILGGYVFDAFLTPWTLLVKALGLALAVASGLSLGKEVRANECFS